MLEHLVGLIGLVDVDAGDESLGGVDAGQQLLARSVLLLAIADFADQGVFIVNVHGPPLLSTLLIREHVVFPAIPSPTAAVAWSKDFS